MSYLHIIRASAGSGKTHKLTGEFLRMAFESDEAFKNILAVTFTVKAAGEMKTRILEELHKLASTSNSSYIPELLADYPHLSPELLQQRAQNILDNVLHDYSSLTISTIDSFVQRVLRAFAFETGATAGFNIEMDVNNTLAELTAELYRNIAKDKTLQNWLEHFAIQRIEEGKRWSFKSDIEKLGKELFTEKFMNLSDQMAFPSDGDGNKLHQQMLEHLKSTIYSLDQYHKALRDEAAEVVLPHFNFGRSPLSKIINLITSPLGKIEKSNIEKVKEIVGDTHLYFNKSEKNPQKLEYYTHVADYQRLAYKQIEFLEKYLEMYITARMILKQFNVFGIILYLKKLLPEYRKTNNIMLLSDATFLLRKLINNNETPFIYEKMGMRIKHLLIDEFQDTSGFQMDNFRPVLFNSLAEGHDSLIVGDIKQSIYRWRGGDWKLLHSGVKKVFGQEVVQESTLTTNYRSKKNIIDFNNMLFKTIAQSVQLQFEASMPDGKINSKFDFDKIIEKAYADVEQKSSGNFGGRVEIIANHEIALKALKPNSEMLPLNQLAEKINELLQSEYYRPKDICILVRKNQDAETIMAWLHTYQTSSPAKMKYDMVSAESAIISNSIQINIIILLMRYINRPADLLSLTNALYFWHESQEKQFWSGTDNLNHDYLISLLPPTFSNLLENSATLSLLELAEELIRMLDLRTSENVLYIHAFLDLIFGFMQKGGNTLDKFLTWWEKTGQNKSLNMPDSLDAVTLMTIHKSKGLAFKIVMLPFIEWPLHKFGTDSLVWVENPFQEYKDLNPIPIGYNKEIVQSIYTDEYAYELMHQYMDALNMLYVALTRPRTEMYLWITAVSEGSKSESLSVNIHNAIKNSALEFEIDQQTDYIRYTYAPGFDAKSPFLRDNTKRITSLPTQHLDWRNKLVIRHKSSDFYSMSLSYIQQQKEYGTFMHEVLSTIDTPDDLENSITKLYARGSINRSEIPVLKTKLAAIISAPIAADWFAPKWNIIKEKALLDMYGHLHIPDRIVMNEHEIQIIDFKFAKPADEHLAQVAQYSKLLLQMYNLPVRAFLYYPELAMVKEWKEN